MATSQTLKKQLRLVLEEGIHPTSGKPVYKNKTFNNIITTANAEQLLAVGTALAELQELPLHEINELDTSMISAD